MKSYEGGLGGQRKQRRPLQGYMHSKITIIQTCVHTSLHQLSSGCREGMGRKNCKSFVMRDVEGQDCVTTAWYVQRYDRETKEPVTLGP